MTCFSLFCGIPNSLFLLNIYSVYICTIMCCKQSESEQEKKSETVENLTLTLDLILLILHTRLLSCHALSAALSYNCSVQTGYSLELEVVYSISLIL